MIHPLPHQRPYTTDAPLHFVGRSHPTDHDANWNTLQSVLRAGCISHPPHENGWGSTRYTLRPGSRLAEGELIVPTITCYCDIPIESIRVHASKYGCFGVAIDREYLVKYGARPVTYVPLHPEDRRGPFGATMLADHQAVFDRLHQRVSFGVPDAERRRTLGEAPDSIDDLLVALNQILAKDVLAFIKPFDSTLDDHHENNYYMEREWRKFGNLVFEPDHVKHVVVAAGFGTIAAEAFPCYATRITEVAPPLQ